MDSLVLFMEHAYNYWGKTDKQDNYHLLVYHCLDVAAAANEYLNRYPTLLEAISEGLGLSSKVTKSMLLLFIALHDVGKFSTWFQSKNSAVFHELNSPERQVQTKSSFFHDGLGAAIWREHIYKEFIKSHLSVNDNIDAIDMACSFAILMGACIGHHGQPVDLNDKDKRRHHLKGFTEFDKSATVEFFKSCATLFEVQLIDIRQYQTDGEWRDRVCRVSWWISGLTVLSDWIGSNIEYFPYEQQPVDLSEYWIQAQQRAHIALSENGLNLIQMNDKQNYLSLFNINIPRSLQRYAAAIEVNNEAQMFILEDMTGSGKTEAALMLAYRIMLQSDVSGLYFALPTMATANGIYHRLFSHYQKFFNNSEQISLVLAHANSKLVKKFQQSLKHGELDKSIDEKHDTASAYCNAWFFDNRKKALLANLGVGTIDQALQAILPNRHQSLRLLGLFRKILIVDEVHACDDYVLELLRRLITFHTASGGSTILLSATLPYRMRCELTESFYSARCDLVDIPELPPSEDYPLATYCCVNSSPMIKAIKPEESLKREVSVALCDDVESIKDRILHKLHEGYCVCWIRNTVADAISIYQEFITAGDVSSVTLFHSRFTQYDRYQIEAKICRTFGPDSSVVQRRGQLVIATHVIEQSLDLDFDYMVSDLAPVDLIIQRIGRLQRHSRAEVRGKPCLLVYSPMPEVEIKADWYETLLPKSAGIYGNHAQLWLTAKLLRDNPVIRIPEQVRSFVETVYADNHMDEVPSVLINDSQKAEGKQRANKETGKLFSLELDSGYQLNGESSWVSDKYVPTRLAEYKTVFVYLARWDGQRLMPWHGYMDDDWSKCAINVPCYYLPETESMKDTDNSLSLLEQACSVLTEDRRLTELLVMDKIEKRWLYLSYENMKFAVGFAFGLNYCADYGLVYEKKRLEEFI